MPQLPPTGRPKTQSRRAQFEEQIRMVLRQSRSLEPEARQRILDLLAEARRRIVAQLASLRVDQTFLRANLRQLKQEIEIAFNEFSGKAAQVTQQLQQRSAQLGIATVNIPLAAVRKPLPFPVGLSRTTLGIAQDFSADLISGLSKQAAAQVNAALQRAFLGGQSLTSIIEQVAQGLGAPGKLDLFSKIGERATTIAINEIKRVHSIAAQERLRLAAERNADLKKQWRWVDVGQRPRPGHQMDAIHGGANGQVRPVNEDFLVASGMGGGGLESLAFPRDPKGSAGNTINCHCIVVPYFDAEDLADLRPSDEQRRLLEEFGISIEIGGAAA